LLQEALRMDELISDKKRQAVPTLKGFTYQIWQSVLRWVSLNDTGVIFLEGAEDLDVLQPHQAETIQVKATAENITLQSTAVQEAIVHYWQHQQANPNDVLYFRLLTTSERGRERGNPFGDRRGLDVWDSCKFDGANCTALRSFLASQSYLPEDLRNFINGASDEELRQRLLTRIEWDTGAYELPYVEEAVIRRVSGYGERAFDLSQSESEKVVPHLLDYAWKTVIKENDRRLDRASFRRIFENVTNESVPKTVLRKLRHDAQDRAELNQLGAIVKQQSGASSGPAISGELILTTFIPTVSEKLLTRDDLVADYQARLNIAGLLVLRGSTGMGKSTMADNVARTLPGAWRKLDLRGLKPEQIVDRLNYATQLIEDQQLQIDCVIDDLNFDRETLLYENSLGRFIYAVKNRNGRIIITTQGTLPSRIVHLYDLPSSSFAPVPPLSEHDIKQLSLNYGCTEAHHLKAWSRIIYLSTRGHPQLAHARVRSLEARGWPPVTSQEVVAAPDLEEVRRESRNRLRDSLPSDEARLLLYRLSILTHFRKQQAIALGSYTPPVRLAGEVFDSLTGPWIETVDGTRFRLSPLLDNAAAEMFSPAEIKELNAIAARFYLTQRTIDVTDFNALLLHGLLGEAADALSAAVMNILSVPQTHWPQLSQVLNWFTNLAVGASDQLYPEPLMNVLLRHMQFRVAAEGNFDRAVLIAEICLREMEEIDDAKLLPDSKRAMQVTFLSNTLFSLQVPFPIKTVVAQLLQIIPLLRDSKPFLAEAPDFDAARDASVRAVLNAEVCLRAAVGRCETAAAVIEFLSLLNDKSPEDTREIWEIFNRDNYLSMMLVDRIWLGETRQSAPDWKLCIERLGQAAEIAKAKKAAALVAATFRAKALVEEEYLKNTEAAIATLDEGDAEASSSAVYLDDYRAKVLFLDGRLEEALALWRKVLPILEEQGELGRPYSYRDAEICAGKLGLWQEAAELARSGEAAARQPWLDLPDKPLPMHQAAVTAAGFKADYAFALWKAGERAQAVRDFAEVLDGFSSLPSPDTDLKSNLLYKRIGYAIGWLVQEGDPEPDFIEPPSGFFSNPDLVEEVKNTPIQPASLLWYLLAKLEYRLHIGDDIFKRFEKEANEVNSMDRIGYRQLKLSHALTKLELSELVADFLLNFVELEKFAAESGLDQPGSASPELIKLLLAALIRLTGEGKFHSAPLARWKKEVAKSELLDQSMAAWLDFALELECADTATLIRVVRDTTARPENRVLAAVVASARMDIDPENRFYANALVTITELNRSWLEATEATVADLIVTGWTKVAENERFALKSPALNAPAIIAAGADESATGLAKAARVLLAARNAIELRIGGPELEALRRVANLPEKNTGTKSAAGS
jgi:hypothetical protein